MTYEVNNEIAAKVLQLIYDSWFKDFYAGIAIQDLIANTKNVIATANDNQINQVLGYLQNNGLIIEDEISRYRITAYGIDIHEQSLSLEVQAAKKHERTRILQILAETYQIDTNEMINSEVLRGKMQIQDPLHLLIIVTYLEEKNLVYMKKYAGTLFFIRLSPEGFGSLKDPINDNSVIMTNAYQLLFSLENFMRRYIENKLISYHKNDWWENGVSLSIKDKVKDVKEKERKAIFQVSEVNSDMDYLFFADLKGIIIKNWKLIFEAIFLDLDKIKSRLDLLEDIRNAIAHTRTLTVDGMNRLNQNYNDLMNMMSII